MRLARSDEKYNILVGKPDGEETTWKTDVDGKIIL
jgi:hypothetical protein